LSPCAKLPYTDQVSGTTRSFPIHRQQPPALRNSFGLTLLSLVSLFIRAPDLGFLNPLYSKARFFISDPARKIRETNEISILNYLLLSQQ
jgi:hypothetical protein